LRNACQNSRNPRDPAGGPGDGTWAMPGPHAELISATTLPRWAMCSRPRRRATSTVWPMSVKGTE